MLNTKCLLSLQGMYVLLCQAEMCMLWFLYAGLDPFLTMLTQMMHCLPTASIIHSQRQSSARVLFLSHLQKHI